MTAPGRPDIRAFIGASGSGKGVSIARELRALKPRRLLVWDARGEYAAHAGSVPTLPMLVQEVQRAGAGGFRLRYVPAGAVDLGDAFGVLCRLAMAAGQLTLVAEELSDTTSGSHAPPAWRQVITQGRHRGLTVIGAAQRPALIDKTFLGNATFIRCFTLRYGPDRQAMALALDAPLANVQALQTVEGRGRTEINYLERDFRGGKLQKGRIVLVRKPGLRRGYVQA